MISPLYVKRFLGRRLRNSAKAKRFTAAAIDRKLERLDPPPSFATRPMLHQKVSFLLGVTYHSYLYLLEMGLGKSKLALDLFSHFRRSHGARRALVLVPNTSNVFGWVDEVRKHAPHLRVAGVDAYGHRASERRLAAVTGAADVVVCTYAGWLRFVCSKKPRRRPGRGATKNQMVLDPRKAAKVERTFDMLVMDEITAACGNPRSLFSRACRRLSFQCEFRFGLTGTIFGKDPMVIWSQFYLVDHGETLGETQGLYRDAFFHEKQNYFAGRTYEFDKRMSDVLHRMMANRSISYTKDECLDLPRKVPIVHKVVFGREELAYHERIIKQLAEAKGNYQLIKNIFTRLRAVCAGWLPVKDEETGEREYVVFTTNPKQDELLAVLAELPPDEKVVVFNWYRKTGDLVSEALTKAGVGHVRLYSGTTNRAEVQRKFRDSAKVRVMLASSAGAYGLNLQAARHVLLYETPTDPKTRKQMIDRVHRIGQARTVFVHDFVVLNSVEVKILQAIKAGDDLFNKVVKGDDESLASL